MRKGRMGDERRQGRQKLLDSRRQERSVAGATGKVQPRSGAGLHDKGDVKRKDWLVECKRTDNTEFRLKVAELRKIKAQAVLAGMRPLFVVDFDIKRYYVIDADTFTMLERAFYDHSQ